MMYFHPRHVSLTFKRASSGKSFIIKSSIKSYSLSNISFKNVSIEFSSKFASVISSSKFFAMYGNFSSFERNFILSINAPTSLVSSIIAFIFSSY